LNVASFFINVEISPDRQIAGKVHLVEDLQKKWPKSQGALNRIGGIDSSIMAEMGWGWMNPRPRDLALTHCLP